MSREAHVRFWEKVQGKFLCPTHSVNHLISATKPGVSASYLYDPAHRQGQKTVGSTKTRYIYAGFQRIAEYDGTSGSLQNRFVYGMGLDDTLIQVTASGTVSYFHHDRMGNIIATADSTGVVTNKYKYSPYGESAALSGTTHGFQGQRYDAETGLYYMKMRYYDPKTGRFLQPDPIGYGDGLNLYRFVGNNPNKFSDPLGLAADRSRLFGDASYPLSQPAGATESPGPRPGEEGFADSGQPKPRPTRIIDWNSDPQIFETLETMERNYSILANNGNKFAVGTPLYVDLGADYKGWKAGDRANGPTFMADMGAYAGALMSAPANKDKFYLIGKNAVFANPINDIFGNRIRHQLAVGYLIIVSKIPPLIALAFTQPHEFFEMWDAPFNEWNAKDSSVDFINNLGAMLRARTASSWEEYAQQILRDAYWDARNGYSWDRSGARQYIEN